MKKVLKVLIFITLLFVTRLIYAVLAWEDVNFGMSPDEVISIVQHSIKVRNSDTTTNPVKERVRVNDYNLGGFEFILGFYFVKDKLSNVLLTKKADEKHEKSTAVIKQVESILTKRYGQPMDRKTSNILFVTESVTKWQHNDLNVSLVVTGTDNETINIFIREI